MKAHPEQDLQITIAGLLDWALPDGYWYTAIDHTYHGERRGFTLRKMGVKKGLLDMGVFGPDRFVGWLENKSLKGALTTEQKALITMFRSMGHQVAICRSLEDAVAALSTWGIQLRTVKLSTERIRRGFLGVKAEQTACVPIMRAGEWPEPTASIGWPASADLGRRRRKAKI